MRPAVFQVGGVIYWTLLTRNPDTGVLKDADSTPTVAVRKNGSSVADSVTVTKRSATTGIYDCSYNPAGEVEGDAFTLEESATVTGTTTSSATYVFGWSIRTVRTGAVELDSTSIMAIYNTMPDAGFVDGSMGDRWLISSSNQRTVAVTGSNHIAADVHNCQPDGLTDSTEIAAINTFATRVTTGIVQDGAVWQFTANMLELAPSSGGGSGDASQATLLAVKAKTDLIGTAAGATQLLAASVLEPGAITSFPETLRVGDSYTDVIGRGIQLPIVDTDGVALTSAGNKNFADAIATFVIKRANDTEPSRIITGTAVFVDPPGTGTGEAPYALIEIPSSETAKGLVKYRYTGLLTFTWPYVGTGTDAEVMTFETGTITFET